MDVKFWIGWEDKMSFVDDLEAIGIEELEEHVFELFVNRAVSERDLGFVGRKKDSLEVTVNGQDLEIRQSISLLNSGKEKSTTGAVAWKVSPLFCEWVLTSGTVLHGLVVNRQRTILEFGSGVGGILAVTIGPKVRRFIATDQEHLLKLLRENIAENLPTPSKRKPTEWDVKALEYDWEYADQLIVNLEDELLDVDEDGVIIACDTIYNDFLIPHFVNALLTAVKKIGPNCHIILAQQLRAEPIMEAILRELLSRGFHVWNVPDCLLSPELVQGFAVHYVRLNHDTLTGS